MKSNLTKFDPNQLVKGSLADVAKLRNQPLAESFLDADCIVIVDVSGSMDTPDAPGGKSRYAAACSELATLQNTLPGKIVVIAFSTTSTFCPNGVPPFLSGGTNLAGALEFAKVTDVEGIRFVVISDGEPQDEQGALRIARTYKNRIDVIYVGSELDPTGRDFLTRLAKASGGQAVTADRVKQLSATVQYLLAA